MNGTKATSWPNWSLIALLFVSLRIHIISSRHFSNNIWLASSSKYLAFYPCANCEPYFHLSLYLLRRLRKKKKTYGSYRCAIEVWLASLPPIASYDANVENANIFLLNFRLHGTWITSLSRLRLWNWLLPLVLHLLLQTEERYLLAHLRYISSRYNLFGLNLLWMEMATIVRLICLSITLVFIVDILSPNVCYGLKFVSPHVSPHVSPPLKVKSSMPWYSSVATQIRLFLKFWLPCAQHTVVPIKLIYI